VAYPLNRRASIKDIIEALGVPHTEVGEILANGHAVDFSFLPEGTEKMVVLPLTPPVDPTVPTLLRPTPYPWIRFLVDRNVAKLGRLLRLCGIDAEGDGLATDLELAKKADAEKRVLLTRDRQLLKHRLVEHGHLVRAADPEEQLIEVVLLYGLGPSLMPFSRCSRCNLLLTPVSKAAIIHRLEPLTRRYYHSFRICPGCDRIYWPGSHRERMEKLLARLRERVGRNPHAKPLLRGRPC